MCNILILILKANKVFLICMHELLLFRASLEIYLYVIYETKGDVVCMEVVLTKLNLAKKDTISSSYNNFKA